MAAADAAGRYLELRGRRVNKKWMGVACAALLLNPPAWADETGKNADDPALETVIVNGAKREGYAPPVAATTATKSDAPWLETPVSVQVVTRDLMDDTQTVRLKDAVQYVSGVIAYNPAGSFDYDNFVIRGFYDYYLTSIYRNGLQTRRAAFESINVERVEILKGPASVLYGRTEPGGIVNRVIKQPLDTFHGEIAQQIGSFDHYRTTLDLGGPIDEGKRWKYRLSAAYLDADAFYDINHQRREFVAPALSWRLGPDTEIQFNGEYKQDKQRYYDGVPIVDGRPAPIPITTFLGFGGDNEFETLKNAVGELSFTHRVDPDWTVRGRYHHQWYDYLFNTYFSAGLQADNRTLTRGTYYAPYDKTHVDQSNLELGGRLEGHRLLVGFDWHRYRNKGATYCCDTPGPNATVDIYHPTYGPYPDPASIAPNNYSSGDERWYGLYLQDQIDIGGRWHLLLGGRQDWASKRNGSSASDFASQTYSELSEQQFSPRVGALVDIRQGLAAYASYSESFGVANGRGFDGAVLSPEAAQQEEIGLKLDAGGLTASLALYNLTKQHLSAPDPDHFGFNVAAGEARSRGVEMDVSAQLARHVNLIASYSYTDAALTRDSSLGAKGNRLIAAPRHMGSLWAKYDLTAGGKTGLSLSAGLYAASRREVDYAGTAQLPGYLRTDAGLAYRVQDAGRIWTVQLNANNLLDRRYYEAGGYGPAGVFPGASRTLLGLLKLEL